MADVLLRLVCRSEYHLGSHCSHYWAVQSLDKEVALSKKIKFIDN